jgi:hypothetical protein
MLDLYDVVLVGGHVGEQKDMLGVVCVCMHEYVYVRYAHGYIHKYVCVCVCAMCVCIYAHTVHKYMHIHTYTYIRTKEYAHKDIYIQTTGVQPFCGGEAGYFTHTHTHACECTRAYA